MAARNKTVIFTLNPIEGVIADPFVSRQWNVKGEAPLFELSPDNLEFPAGWVQMTTTIHRKGSDFTAKLFVHSGASFLDIQIISIPATRKGRVNHIFKLPPQVTSIRWSPMRGEGLMLHGPMFMTEIGQFERIARMFVWVANDLWKFRRTGQASRHGLSVFRMFFDLQGAYDASAKLRFNFAPPSYVSFVQQFDTVQDSDKHAISNHIAALPSVPLFSVWANLFGDLSIAFVDRALDSLRNQLYPQWELVLVVVGQVSSHMLERICQLAANDPRITVIPHKADPNRSQPYLEAMLRMSGDFVIELDLCDQWAPQALYHVAVEINRHPGVGLLYADEDCLSGSGQRRLPYFKSDWNQELFYSRNLIGHFCVYRTNLVEAARGLASDFPAARRLDLALRCVAMVDPENIRHIPFVLCHRGQPAEWDGQQPYVDDLAARESLSAMRAHFKNQPGVQVDAGRYRSTFRVQYPLPDPAPVVSLLIPTRDAVEVLRKCIESVRVHTDYPHWEIIVLDNQSTDPAALQYLLEIAADPRIRVVQYDKPFNYSAINNFGAGLARGEIIGLLNNDVEVINRDWLTEMVSHAVRPQIGAVGAKLLYSDGYVQHAGVVVGLGGLAGHVHRHIPSDHPGYAGLAQLTQAFSAVTAACLLVRRKVYLAVGGLDEVNLTVAYNDVDLCLRIRDAGFRNVWTPHAMLYHHESYSRGDDQESFAKRTRFEGEKAYMLKRWHTDTVPDPFYNPNLTSDKEDYSIAHVPRVVKPWFPYHELDGAPKHWWRRVFAL